MAATSKKTAKPASQQDIHDTSSASTPEVIAVDSHADQVSCDGGGGPLGHPLVYYTFEKKDRVTCGYCDREFIRESH
jgi:uncharacterized Zn-finger protein